MAAPRQAPALARRLKAAAAALEAGDGAAALEVLLEVWGRERLPRVGRAVVQLGRRLDVEAVPTGASQKDDYLRWVERAQAARPVDVGPLLAALTHALGQPSLRDHFVRGRLRLLAAFPTDPRIATAVKTVDALHFGLRWSGEFQRAARRHLRPAPRGASALEEALGGPFAALERAIATAVLKPVAVAAAPSPGAGSASQLVAAVWADPGNDELRLIAADRLSEEGDPLGEFITLQFQRRAGTQTAEGAQREAALRKKHGAQWLGPLAAQVVKSEARFERGFPFAVRTVANRVYKARESLGAEAWATVEQIEFGPLSFFGPTMRSLTVARGVENTGLQMLLALDARPPLRLLELYPASEPNRSPRDWAWPRLLAQLRGLEELEVGVPRTGLPYPVEPVMAAVAPHLPASLRRLALFRVQLKATVEPERVRRVLALAPPHLSVLQLNDEVLTRVEGGWERRRR